MKRDGKIGEPRIGFQERGSENRGKKSPKKKKKKRNGSANCLRAEGYEFPG